MNELAEYNAIFKLIDFTLLQNHLTAFDLQKKLLAIAENENIYIYNTKTKKQITTLHSHDGAVTQLYFLEDGLHIIYVTQNARVIVTNYMDTHYSVRLYSTIKKFKTQFPIRITTLALSKYLLAVGSADGKVVLINLNSYARIKEFHKTNASISTLCFSDKSELIGIDAHGEIFIYDLQGIKQPKRTTTHLSHTKQILHIPKSDFLLINSHKEFLTLFDLNKNKIILNEYLHFSHPVSYIELTQQNNLLTALQDREILHIILDNRENLKSLLLHNMLDDAYSLVEQNPQLLTSKEYKELEKVYNRNYLKALKALEHNDITKAQQILKSCKNIKNKQEDIKLLFEAYRHYKSFKDLVMGRKFAPAYALANRYPPLQYSKEYKTMEKEYKKAYTSAQKQILLSNLNAAKELLVPYLGVISKKESINLILKENSDFLDFLDALKQDHYSTIQRVLRQHPHFTDLPPYKKFLHHTKKTIEKINALLNAASVEQADELIQHIEALPFISSEITLLRQKEQAIKILLSLYSENKFKECYVLLDEEQEMFLELKLAHLLEKHWTKLIEKCEKYALYGNVKGIKQTLRELLTLKSRSKRVGELLRTAFIVKIEENITQKNPVSAENFIYTYIDIFGDDTNLKRVMQLYEKKATKKLAITPHTTKVARDAWLHNKLITTPSEI